MSASERNDDDIVVIGAARTPIGSFGGTLRDLPVWDLGAAAIRAAIERSGVDAGSVDKVIYGNCRQAGNGPNPARTAAVKGGLPIASPVMTVNMACPSAMKTVMLAARELQVGDARVVMAGGMESMSTMPYLLKGARWEGFRSGDKTLLDSWSDTIDPLYGFGMGMTAENLAEKYGITREAQDKFACESQRKAVAARAAGLFDREIVPLRVPVDRMHPEGQWFAHDEGGRADTTFEKLARLRAVFRGGGTVTAGNACTMGDAACALLVTTRKTAHGFGVQPLFSIVAFAETAVEPSIMGDGPSVSIPMVLRAAGMALDDMDFIEVNEAFAAQVIANERALRWDRSRLNAWGGAIALGHPTGFTGARLLLTLSSILRHHDREFGVAAICGGGGVTTAMVIRRES